MPDSIRNGTTTTCRVRARALKDRRFKLAACGVRVLGGIEAHPSSFAISPMCCFDVVHSANFFAESCDFEIFGIVKDHDHSQCESIGVTATCAAAKPILSATRDWTLL
jgi:hypothetical protein